MRNCFLMLTGVLIFFLAIGGTVKAQDESSACSTLVNRALSHVGSNCRDLDDNSACYGFEHVTAVVAGGSVLVEPSDRADLLGLMSLQTSPFDSSNEIWGISVLKVQADLPASSEQLVNVFLLGDVRLENAVDSSHALVLSDTPVAVTPRADAIEIYDKPIDFGVLLPEIVGHVNSSDALLADGISPTGQWVRVVFEFEMEYGNSATAWVSLDDLVDNPDIDTLPTIGPESYAPMQAFYFETNTGIPECASVPPSSLIIQGPDDIEVTIVANGAEIRVTNSTIVLQTSANHDMMRLIVLSGFARVEPGSPEEMIIPAGYTTTICLDGTYNLGSDDEENDYIIGEGCRWASVAGLSQEYLGSLNALEQLPDNLLNYQITIPEQICATGIGGVVCEYRYADSQYIDEMADLCGEGLLSDDICMAVVPGVIVQNENEECSETVEAMHSASERSCSNLDMNTICYASNDVVATFSDRVAFQQPGDRAKTPTFVASDLMTFDTLENVWGILALNTRADLPNTFTEQSVYSVVLGDARLENQTASAEALILLEQPVEVVSTATADIYSFPDEFVLAVPRVVGSVQESTTLQADGISPSGEWVRVSFRYETDFGFLLTAWIRRDALAESVEIDTLPVIGSLSYTPMQAFYLETGEQVASCVEATPVYMMQSPDDVELTINVNGADIRVNGTILLQALPDRRLMRLITLTGIARIQPGFIDQLVIPAGYSAITCLDGPYDLGADGVRNDFVVGELCDWYMTDRVDEDTFVLFSPEYIPDGLLNYPIFVPELVCVEQECDYKDTNPAYSERLAHLCDEGYLSDSICRFVDSS